MPTRTSKASSTRSGSTTSASGSAASSSTCPFTAYNDWGAAVANNYISETVGTLNVSYNFLSNYYFSGVAVGANLKVAYRNIPDIASLSVYNQSALAFMGDVGAQTSFNFLKFYNSQSQELLRRRWS